MGAWEYVIMIISTMLLAFVARQEYRRGIKNNLLLRLFAVSMAVISLACFALPPTINKSIALAKGEVLIKTDGYAADSVNQFLKSTHKNMPVYTLDEYKALEKTDFKTVHVFGYGLSTDEMQWLKDAHVIFHPSAIGTGIISANWKHVLQTGERLRVQGSFVNTTGSSIKLVLSGLNTVLDSITIQPNRQTNFELSTIPKNTGKAVYSLTAIAKDKTIEEEFVPFEVKQPDSLTVLVLAASPDFENKFLKNWLAQNAFNITMRTTISKGKFGKAFMNTQPSDVDKITAALLDKFDVLVTDASAFAALSSGEQNAIRSKVEDGLGLIIKTDTVLPNAYYAPTFSLYAAHAKTQKMSVKSAGDNSFSVLPDGEPLYIKPAPGTVPLATDSAAQTLAAVGLYGRGKIVLTTINNTYSWMLEGDTGAYYHYWGTLIDNASRQKQQPANIAFNKLFPRMNEKLAVKVETNAGNNMPTAIIGGSNVYLKQDIDMPFAWEGTYWPLQTGWQTASVNNTSQDFYVYDTGDWKYVDAAEKMADTKQYVLKQNKQDGIINNTTVKERVPIPKIYFFILFIICCTVLWVERKLNQ